MSEGHRERMRKRFLKSGSNQMLEHEMLELLLFFCNKRQDTNPIAHRLIDRFGSLFGVLTADIDELSEVEGVGGQISFFLHVVGETMRKAQTGQVERKPLRSVSELCAYCYSLLAGQKTEQFYALFLDVRFNLITTKHMATGLPDQVAVYPRLIAEAALRNGAANVVMTHNHPAGNCQPSVDDLRTTERVQSALAAIDVNFVDHIIVTDEETYAMCAKSRINNRKTSPIAAQSNAMLEPHSVAEYLKHLDENEMESIISILQGDN